MTENNDDRIIRRIKRLLATAEGEANMNESHTAFLMAQEMMVKCGVDPSELTDDKAIPLSVPTVESQESYQQGYEDGHAIDYKKETIDEGVRM